MSYLDRLPIDIKRYINEYLLFMICMDEKYQESYNNAFRPGMVDGKLMIGYMVQCKGCDMKSHYYSYIDKAEYVRKTYMCCVCSRCCLLSD